MAVYFIRNRRTGSYKIGFSTEPDRRLRDLQTANEDELDVVLILERAGEGTESALHKRWEHLKVRGEWYKADPEIEDYIVVAAVREAARKQTGAAGIATFEWLSARCRENPNWDRWLRHWIRLVTR